MTDSRLITPNDPLWMQVCAYLETCDVGEGPDTGKPFMLAPFQIEIVQAVCMHNLIFITMARGNGKTTLMGAFLAACVTGPLAIPNTTIPVVATDKAQAGIAVKHCWNFLQPDWQSDPERFKFNESKENTEIIDRWNNIVVESVSAAPQSKHGKAPPIALLDEPAQWSKTGGEKVFNAMVTGRGKQENSKVVVIGTRPDSQDHWFSRGLKLGVDPIRREGTGIYAVDYSCDVNDKFDDLDAVKKANPMWDNFPHLAETIQNEINTIKAGEGSRASFEAYRMNKGVPESELHEFIFGENTREYWEKCECDVIDLPPRKGPYFVGIDLGEGMSLTAASVYWTDTGRLDVYCGVPAVPNIADRERKDACAGRYQKAIENGELKTYKGSATPAQPFLQDLIERLKPYGLPEAVIADRYKKNVLKQTLTATNSGWLPLLDNRRVGKGKEGIEDLTAFVTECTTGHLKTRKSILMRAAILGAKLNRDMNGNASVDRRDKKDRIDPLISTIHAVGRGRIHRIPIGDDRMDQNIDELIAAFSDDGWDDEAIYRGTR